MDNTSETTELQFDRPVNRDTLTRDQKLAIGKRAIEEKNVKRGVFAARLGLNENTVNYWIGLYRESIGEKAKSPSQQKGYRPKMKNFPVVQGRADTQMQFDNEPKLQRLMDEKAQLEAELSDANQKVDALQKVIIVLGVQL